MNALFEQVALVVRKEEELDPEDRIMYEISFIIKDSEFTNTLSLSTDDKSLYDKFKVGMETTLSFLEKVKMNLISKSN